MNRVHTDVEAPACLKLGSRRRMRYRSSGVIARLSPVGLIVKEVT
jgi:hypothetical protein